MNETVTNNYLCETENLCIDYVLNCVKIQTRHVPARIYEEYTRTNTTRSFVRVMDEASFRKAKNFYF